MAAAEETADRRAARAGDEQLAAGLAAAGRGAAAALLREHLSSRPPAPAAAHWWRQLVLSNPESVQEVDTRCTKAVPGPGRLCRFPMPKPHSVCWHLLRREGAGGPLCQALLRMRLWIPKLYGALPEYDSAALEAVFSVPKEERLAAMQAATQGYRGRQTSRFIVRSQGDADNFWEVKRELGSTDYRRWPPATQALLRRLWAGVAGSEEARPGQRVAAVCLLGRLQDTSPADLEPLVGDPQLTAACLLTASVLPDKSQAVAFLASKFTSIDATHAASALRRVAAHLADAELEEVCGDLLATAGLRTAAWHKVVMVLMERGTPKALELVSGEMQRPDLSPSMRVGLLAATSELLDLPQVAAFWEQAAVVAVGDTEVAKALMEAPQSEVCQMSQESARWWAGLVLGMVQRAAEEGQEVAGWVPMLNVAALKAIGTHDGSAYDCWVAGLFAMAARAPAPGWEVAVWLLRRLVLEEKETRELRREEDRSSASDSNDSSDDSNNDSTSDGSSDSGSGGNSDGGEGSLRPQLGCLARHLAPLLEAAAGEQLEAKLPGTAGPSTRLLLHLLCGPPPTFPSPWQLGLPVAPPLLPLLWSRYVQHLASVVTDVGQLAEEGEGAAASLAAQLSAALADAPGEAMVQNLAAAVLKRGCPACVGTASSVTARAAYVRAALCAACTLEAGAETNGRTETSGGTKTSSPVSMPAGRAVLTAALAAAGWLTSGASGGRSARMHDVPSIEGREQLLCVLRRCLAAAPCHVTQLLESHQGSEYSHCEVPALWAAVLGMAEEGAALEKCSTAVIAALQGRAERRRLGKPGLPMRLPWRQL